MLLKARTVAFQSTIFIWLENHSQILESQGVCLGLRQRGDEASVPRSSPSSSPSLRPQWRPPAKGLSQLRGQSQCLWGKVQRQINNEANCFCNVIFHSLRHFCLTSNYYCLLSFSLVASPTTRILVLFAINPETVNCYSCLCLLTAKVRADNCFPQDTTSILSTLCRYRASLAEFSWGVLRIDKCWLREAGTLKSHNLLSAPLLGPGPNLDLALQSYNIKSRINSTE